MEILELKKRQAIKTNTKKHRKSEYVALCSLEIEFVIILSQRNF